MFLIVPLIILLISVGGIVYILGRKLQYVKKLEPAKEESPKELFVSFFPELVSLANKIDFNEYREVIFVEAEKLLRRLRLAILKIERYADTGIRKVREKYEGSSNEPVEEAVTEPVKEEVKEVVSSKEQEVIDFKQEEQRLIIEIAKDTKNPELYELLGDLYVATGDLIDARESYQVALTLDGHRPFIKNKLDSVIAKIGVDIE